MKRIIKKGLLAATVFGTLTLGACVSDGYYSSGSTGYSTYPYSRPYVYPSGSVSFYYSSPRYYRGYYPRGYYPRHYRYRGHQHYRHHGRYNNRHYYNRPHHGSRPHHYNRPHHGSRPGRHHGGHRR